MSSAPQSRRPIPPNGTHVATIAHDGLLWDTYVEFEDDPQRPASYRARLRFEVADADGMMRVTQTAVIIIEDSHEEVVAKARAMDDRSLTALLRSALPDA